mmetsp:Transcript_5696/g.10216  ORF Transcript_5696/g.10216 Transcript_5696/m.10216 type:complete len:194 (+) Transcript_5696:241-822(+)
MAAWDDIELLDMDFDAEEDVYTYPCPCGDLFIMPVDDLINAEELAPCPSCSLLLRVVYDPDEFLASVEIVDGEEEHEQENEEEVDSINHTRSSDIQNLSGVTPHLNSVSVDDEKPLEENYRDAAAGQSSLVAENALETLQEQTLSSVVQVTSSLSTLAIESEHEEPKPVEHASSQTQAIGTYRESPPVAPTSQ